MVAPLSRQVCKDSVTLEVENTCPGPINARIKCKAKEVREGTEPSLSFVHLQAAMAVIPNQKPCCSADLEAAFIRWGMGRSRGLGTAEFSSRVDEPRTGKHWSHGNTDDTPEKEWGLQNAPVCFGKREGPVWYVGTLQGVARSGENVGFGPYHLQTRIWALRARGCVILDRLPDCSVPLQKTFYLIEVCKNRPASRPCRLASRVRPMSLSQLVLLLFQDLQAGSL